MVAQGGSVMTVQGGSAMTVQGGSKTRPPRPRITLSLRNKLLFYVFTSPFIVGSVLFFIVPFFQSIVFSLSDLTVTTEGYVLKPLGIANYNAALFVNPKFVRTFVEQTLRTLMDAPFILVFSFFCAVLLNQRFRGRTLARVIFFLPVILGSGVLLVIESGQRTGQIDYMMNMLYSQTKLGLLSSESLRNFLAEVRLPQGLLNAVMDAVDHVPKIVRMSGIQILIFLAGLQSVSPSLYEAAEVEGATRWESFWLVTLPMVSPLVVTCLVYTIIDTLMAGDNSLITLIQRTAFGGEGIGVAMAMAIMYFASVAVILGVATAVTSPWVFYHD